MVTLLIPATAAIFIVAKRLKKSDNNKLDYDGNETTYDWERTVNLGASNMSNSKLSTSLRPSLDSFNGSLLGNTSLIDEPCETETVKRSPSFQAITSSSCLENQHHRSKHRRSVRKSLSDTDMFQKNTLYRKNGDNLNANSNSPRMCKVPNNQNEKKVSRRSSSVTKAETLQRETKKKAPPKPKRHRLHRSATGGNFEELKRRACSPIAEENFEDMMKNIFELSHQHNNFRTDARSNIYTNDMDSFNVNAIDIGTQTSAERGTNRKTKVRRKRKIIASSAMSETRGRPRIDQKRKQANRNVHVTEINDKSESNGRESESNVRESTCTDTDNKRLRHIRRKLALQHRAESMRVYKDSQCYGKSKSMSFNYGDSRKYIDFVISSSSDEEVEGFKFRLKSRDNKARTPQKFQQDICDSLNVDKRSDVQEQVSTGPPFDRRKKKSHSLRETGSTLHGEHREQDILKFWSKTYSFLDERKILASQENLEDHKVTSFYETERPQTVSLELEFKSLPTGVLGTTNIARQKADVPAHSLCLESYDHSRVILKPEGPHDYINASYINDRTRGGAPRYIAARTPHDAESALKFWRMVLQEGSRVIVKLSQQPDIFPSEITRHTDQISERFRLTHCEDIYIHKCVVRYMRLRNVFDHSSRGVYIVHNLQWPDDDRYYLPQDTKEFISMREVVRKCQGASVAPVIVHCRQEDGRSGTFIAVDALLLQYQQHREVNIFSFVRNMLKDRYGMVKTIWQYRFIYEALLESHLLN
jgi:protein tyrosine phosphatase